MALTRLGLNQSINLATNTTGTLAVGNGGTGLASGFVNGGGLTVADQWRLTTSFTDSADPIASNFERVDSTGQGFIGSAMTESSGIFTFPATGIYLVRYTVMFYGSVNADTDIRFNINRTINNSDYEQLTRGFEEVAHGANTTGMVESYVDVTDTSNVKVRFDVGSNINLVRGSTSQNQTTMTFIRLGDT